MNNPKWIFPSTNGGKRSGPNEAGIEHFDSNHLLSLAREICQNSLDEKIDNSTSPVRIEFKGFKLPKEKLYEYGYEDLKEVFDNELKYVKKYYKNDTRPIEFYENAKKILQQDEIYCIRISDFNTRGLRGSESSTDESSNWNNLVKGEGFSDKKENAGGSRGLGQNASFACSKLRLVFYSTKDIDGIVASMGVAKLSSFEDKDGDTLQGTGFFGIKETRKITETKQLEFIDKCNYQIYLDPNFSERTEPGTDIYIVGFAEQSEQWATSIAISIIDSYFVSILDNKIVVKIEDIELTKDSLPIIFKNLYKENEKLFNPFTINYLNILMTDKYKTQINHFTMFEKDDVKLIYALDSNFPSRIAMIRNTGMKIFDKSNLRQQSNFAGLLCLEGTEVNKYFRSLENATHDKWIKSKDSQKKMIELYTYIRNTIAETFKQSIPESVDAEGVGEYLPDELESGDNNNSGEGISNDIVEEIVVRDRKTSSKKSKKTDNVPENESNIGIIDDDGKYLTPFSNTTTNDTTGRHYEIPASIGNGNSPITYGTNINTIKNRCIYSNDKYKFIFVSSKDVEKAKISVKIYGEESKYITKIDSAYSNNTPLIIDNNNFINIENIKKDELYTIVFKLQEPGNWALEVNLYENK